MPSATAALVALIASSSASLRDLHLGLGGRADADDGDAACQLGQPLLQLLPVVVAGRLVDLACGSVARDHRYRLLAGAADDGRVLLVDDDALGAAEHDRT